MKPEWKKPDTIDSVEWFSELSDQTLQDLVHRAFENELQYLELKRLAIREQNIRADRIIAFQCGGCGKRSSGYPSDPRVKSGKCNACYIVEMNKKNDE